MSDDDEQQQQLNTSHDADHRRRLTEIRNELQTLMRQKKKYDEEKLKQESDFLHGEINDIRGSIVDMSKEISNQTQTKKKLHVQMTNLRSRSRLRLTNLSTALREKRRFEAELKKENKTDEYRELVREEIRSIDAALPILREEDEYKARLRGAEEAQQAAIVKRQKLEESLNRNLRKQTEIKQSQSEIAEKLPQIEDTIESLRAERERLVSTSTSSSTNGKKSRRRLASLQQKPLDSPSTDAQTPVRSLASLEEDCLEHEKRQHEDQLNKVGGLINYFREKMTEHGLSNEQFVLTPASELTSPLYPPITPLEEQSILSSYMDERDYDNALVSKTSSHESPTAVAMKLPRNFASLNLNSCTSNEIIHSPYCAGNEVEYKKELSSDIVNKYGGQPKKTKQQQLSLSGKKAKKNRKNFAITHNPQMIALYNNVRSSTGSSDTLPSMPMFEYELAPTLHALEFFKQSLESYLNELSRYHVKTSIGDEHQNKSENDDDDIRDSALDTYSERSSLMEPIREATLPIPQMINRLEDRLSVSSDDKKTLTSSSSNKDDQEDVDSRFQPSSKTNGQIDRQISDEGYRSVRHEQQQQVIDTTGKPNSPSLTRSERYNCAEKVDAWLSHSMPTASYADFQSTDNEDSGRNANDDSDRPKQTQ